MKSLINVNSASSNRHYKNKYNKNGGNMKNMKLYNILSKPWVTTNEIMIVAECGRSTASKIRQDISRVVITKNCGTIQSHLEV